MPQPLDKRGHGPRRTTGENFDATVGKIAGVTRNTEFLCPLARTRAVEDALDPPRDQAATCNPLLHREPG